MNARALVLGASLLGGCAYYNGMYNANRSASRAEHAERAGRTAEAADRWRQVLIHADTVLARHPHSRWADDAALLKGRALVALGGNTEAVPALEQAKATAGDEEQLRLAQYWLGIAYAGRRDYPAALANFDSALASSRAGQRRTVRLARGRVLMTMGRPAEALRDFEAVATDEARFERAEASLALDRPEGAAAHADSAVGARGVSAERWQSFLDSLARRDGLASASRLVDRLVADGRMSPTWKARLLLADGDRLAAAGFDSLAEARWITTARMAPDSVPGGLATVHRLQLQLRGPDAVALLAGIHDRLADIATSAGGEASREARDLLRILDAGDSLSAAGGAPDARAYQAAEWLRDSLPSAPLAADAFVAMAAQWPSSPWAPKALLAAVAAGHPAADSLGRVLEEQYRESPYVLVTAGGAADLAAYAAAEDSLASQLEAGRPATGAAAQGEESDEPVTTGRPITRSARARGPAPAPQVRTVPRAPTLPRDPEP